MEERAVEIRKAYYKEYRKKNKEKIKEYNKRYWEKKAMGKGKVINEI